MKILLTGATGYIAKRLLPVLIENQHEVICCVRDKSRFDLRKYNTPNLSIVEVDFLNLQTLSQIPKNIDVAFYLIHSMSSESGDFKNMEQTSAENFKTVIQTTSAKQVVYLSGIVNDQHLSKHLSSRKNVESILSSCSVPLTTLKAGIIIGSGSASFEMIRDLVEKLPVMIAPKWIATKTQPIAIRNVIQFLSGVIGRSETFGKSYDIGGPDILTYKDMLLRFAKVRQLKRKIFSVPIFTPRLSSYWLYFITGTSYSLAKNLVDSMSVEVVCKPNNLRDLLNIQLINYETAIQLAFDKIEQNQVLSSWTDAFTSKTMQKKVEAYLEVPQYGCYKIVKKQKVSDPVKALEKIWSIGGRSGWYYADFLWKWRGFIDKLLGGVGVRRGRKNPTEISIGDAIDFWRVVFADKSKKRLLLYAEMKLPGEAWLEFQIDDQTQVITQTATFRPRGVLGRFYWYVLWPLHFFIFRGMLKSISKV